MEGLKYIIVDGLVKTGKTTLAKMLANELQARLICENKENPFLKDFYINLTKGNPELNLKTQLVFLINRFQQQQEIAQKSLFQKITISNYHFDKDAIYAHSILNENDLEIYKKIYQVFQKQAVNCNLLIYLQTSYTEMLARIQKFGTDFEKDAPQEYWRTIFEAYNYYFFNYKASPLLVINVEKISFLNFNIQNLIKEIKNLKKGTTYYAP